MSNKRPAQTYGYDNRDPGEDRLPPINQVRNTQNYGHQQEYDMGNISDDELQGINDPRGRVSQATGPIRDSQMPNRPSEQVDYEEGRAIQLVQANAKTGQFQINEDVRREIERYEGNVAFVSIVGKFKSGKSTLLNKLLGLGQEGYPVDPNSQTTTDGIWVWTKPIFIEKDNLHVFFLDFEGSHNYEKSNLHDSKMFALAVLLSSLFIYNSSGVIDENAINEISAILKLDNFINVSGQGNDADALSYYTPKLVWVLRDFNYDLTDAKGRPIKPNDYFESALNDLGMSSQTSDTNRKIRNCLIKYFKERECVTLATPAQSAYLKKINSMPEEALDQEFQRNLIGLREKITAKVSAKQLRGVNLNSRMFFAMLSNYIDSLNNNKVPNLALAWDSLIENECQEALENAIELYEIALKQFFLNRDDPQPAEDLYHIFKNIRDSALENFTRTTAQIEKNVIVDEFKNQLKDYIDKKELLAVKINEEMSQNTNQDLIKILAQEMEKNIEENNYNPIDPTDFNEQFKDFLENYEERGKGTGKTTSLVNYLGGFQDSHITLLFQRAQEFFSKSTGDNIDAKAKLEEKTANLRKNKEALQGELQTLQKQEDELRDKKETTEQQKRKMEKELEKMKKEQATIIAEKKADAQRKSKKQVDLKQAELAKESERNEKLLKEIEERNKKAKGCCNIF